MKKNLTPEQNKELDRLVWKHTLSGFVIFVKYVFLIFLSDCLTVGLNFYYVKSESFVFPVVMINAIFLISFMLKETKTKRDKFNENLKKILLKDLEVK
jgi:Flp pilus assembly protein TadB